MIPGYQDPVYVIVMGTLCPGARVFVFPLMLSVLVEQVLHQSL